MKQPAVTFVVNNRTYSLSASDTEAMRNIPAADRQQLITLLEAIKVQDSLARAAVQAAAESVIAPSQAAIRAPETGNRTTHQDSKPERLGSGDVDALMARLILEEKQNQKPGLTKQGLYKVLVGAAVFIFFLVLIT
jgi:hypothetical protein